MCTEGKKVRLFESNVLWPKLLATGRCFVVRVTYIECEEEKEKEEKSENEERESNSC